MFKMFGKCLWKVKEKVGGFNVLAEMLQLRDFKYNLKHYCVCFVIYKIIIYCDIFSSCYKNLRSIINLQNRKCYNLANSFYH